MSLASGMPAKPVFSMEQLAFIGFFQGPLGLGLALALCLHRIGRSDLIKKVLLVALLASVAEALVLLSSLGNSNAVVFHLAGAILAKVFHDRWLFIPYRNQGQGNVSRGEFVVYFLVVHAIFIACFSLLPS